MAEVSFLRMTKTSSLTPHPDNPRRTFDETQLGELAESIKTHGILEPLVVVRAEGWDVKTNDVYMIVCGERRWRASQLAGVTEVPCVVRDMDRTAQLEAMIIENSQRAEVNAIEEAVGFKILISEAGYSQEQLAEAIGKSQPYVANRLRLLELPQAVRESISRGILSPSVGRELLRLSRWPDICTEYAADMAENGVPSKRAAAWIDERLSRRARPLGRHGYPPPEFDPAIFDDHPDRIELMYAGSKKPFLLNVEAWEVAQANALQKKAAGEARRIANAPTAPAGVSTAAELAATVDETELNKIIKKAPRTREMPYGSYKELDAYGVDFDTSVCDGCEFRKLARDYNDQLVAICTNVPEFEKKQKAVHRERNKDARQTLAEEYARIREAAKPWVERLAILDRRLLIYLAYRAINTTGALYQTPSVQRMNWKAFAVEFLGKGFDGFGHEMDGWEPHVKALQQLDESILARIVVEFPALAMGANAVHAPGILLGDITPLSDWEKERIERAAAGKDGSQLADGADEEGTEEQEAEAAAS